LFFSGDLEDSVSTSDPPPEQFYGELCQGLTEVDCTQVYVLNVFTLMFMILPAVIPGSIAAYSIVGEKTTRSLEPLLATPITIAELIIAKATAAAVPAIAATWLGFGIYLAGVRLMASEIIFAHILDPMWFIAIFIVGPLLTLTPVAVAIIVSSRATDPRVAEQISAIVVLPIIMLIAGQAVGWILLDQQLIIFIALATAVLDVGLLYLSFRIFQRETILTRWK
jgi:ABC-2 type transport system permease protein